MKVGAKVFVDGSLFLVELERILVPVRTGARLDPLSGENDWFRAWPGGLRILGLELCCMDLGLPSGIDEPGEGDAESRVNGLVRHRGPFTAGTDIATTKTVF